MMFLGQTSATTLFEETFDNLDATPGLNPFVSSSESGGDGADWINLADAQAGGSLTGWTLDNTTTPAPAGGDPDSGPEEFFGWTFMDPVSWDATAGQGRSNFTKGTGVIAVADGDEYDDIAPGIEPSGMNTLLETPVIDLSGVDADDIIVSFDSSFFPFGEQVGTVDLSFDGGGTWENVLTLDTASAGGNSNASRLNESILLAGGSDFTATGNDLKIRFGYVGGNDWWWAFDNVRVTIDEPFILSQPAGGSIFEGSSFEFSVDIAGGAATFQWFLDDGSGPVALVDAGTISGSTTDTLSIGSATFTDVGEYFCEVTLGGSTVVSDSATLEVNPLATSSVYFVETFDRVPLGSSVDEGLAADGVWTATPPTGWTLDNSDLGGGGVTEWQGWTFADPNWWIDAAGNQDRSSFTRASCATMIGDPDEWDDAARDPLGFFNSVISSPLISISDAQANGVKVRFHSSFRPYADMTGVVEASFDGGSTFEEILRLDTPSLGGNSVLDRANSSELLELNNPQGDFDLQLRYSLLNAGNDWWWAVDNIVVFEGSAPPDVLAAPQSQAVLAGGDTPVTFEVQPDGNGPFTFQWFFDDLQGGGPVPLNDGGIVSGSDSDTLLLTGPGNMASGKYTVEISNPVGTISTCANLDLAPAFVDLQPIDYVGDQALISGADLLFLDAIIKSNDPNISFRILKDDGSGAGFEEIPETVGDQDDVPFDIILDSFQDVESGLWCHEITWIGPLADFESSPGQYKLEATNEFGTVETNAIGAEVVSLVITEQPDSATMIEGDSLVLFAVADTIEFPFTYQWFRGVDDPETTDVDERTPIEGEGGDAFALSPVELDLSPVDRTDAGIYTLDLTIPQGTVTTDPVLVTVFVSEGTTKLFVEDFEGLPLGASPEEDPASTDVWTQTPPDGWTADNSGVPGFGDPGLDGVSDWAGWSFANVDWWVDVAGNQDRNQFTRATGTAMIGDPDEWDDAPTADGTLNTFLTTPVIDLSGAPEGSVVLGFDSSFRPYADQTGTVEVSLDGGVTFQDFYVMDTPTLGGNSVLDRVNERVALPVANGPGASALQVRFGLTDAGNDWWWALDNICVSVSLPEIVLTDVGFDGQSLNLIWDSSETATYGVQYFDEGSLNWVDLATGITGQLDSTSAAIDLSTVFNPIPETLVVRVVEP